MFRLTVSVLSVGYVPAVIRRIWLKTDELAAKVLEELAAQSPKEIQQQMHDNIRWIKAAAENHLVVGSQARHPLRRC